MRTAATVLGVAFVSAFFPVVNLETYVVLMAAGFRQQGDVWHLVLLAAAATIGQVAGKYLLYEAGRNSTRWAWLQRKLERPKIAARLDRWTEWSRHHSSVSGLVLFASASSGVPPFMIMSVVAGRLKVHRAVFLVSAIIGRFIRFLVTGGVVEMLHFSLPV